MEVRNYRANSLQEALRQVRRELGPEAAVLRTREVRRGMWSWLSGSRQIEVTASLDVDVPTRFPIGCRREEETESAESERLAVDREPSNRPAAKSTEEIAVSNRDDFKTQLDGLRSLVEELCRQSAESRNRTLPAAMFSLFTDLVDAAVCEEIARELIERVRLTASESEWDDAVLLKARLARLLENEIDCRGPLAVEPGRRLTVALVGPTGVGKTTTIAKLAAQYHLQHRCRVGLLTLDTYRIAAVDQLRTYAEIIDLPMEVAATPREVRPALGRLADMDLVLIDTVGRSPRDELHIQELRSMLEESDADEVHLVLSAVASTPSMKIAAERFAPAGVNALVLTKLDEASGPGAILPVLRSTGLPLSYVTQGQNVPQDIASADRRQLARTILGLGSRSVTT